MTSHKIPFVVTSAIFKVMNLDSSIHNRNNR